jgi:hypothetical protein
VRKDMRFGPMISNHLYWVSEKKEETWIEQIRECGYPEAAYETDFISAG